MPIVRSAVCMLLFLEYPDFLDYPDSLTTLTFLDYPDWGFSLLLLSCKANARVKLAKSGHGPHLLRIVVFCVVLVIVLCYCLYAVLLLLCCTVIVLLCYYLCCPMYWLCVLYRCHRVLTQLQLTNISYPQSFEELGGMLIYSALQQVRHKSVVCLKQWSLLARPNTPFGKLLRGHEREAFT